MLDFPFTNNVTYWKNREVAVMRWKALDSVLSSWVNCPHSVMPPCDICDKMFVCPPNRCRNPKIPISRVMLYFLGGGGALGRWLAQESKILMRGTFGLIKKLWTVPLSLYGEGKQPSKAGSQILLQSAGASPGHADFRALGLSIPGV